MTDAEPLETYESVFENFRQKILEKYGYAGSFDTNEKVAQEVSERWREITTLAEIDAKLTGKKLPPLEIDRVIELWGEPAIREHLDRFFQRHTQMHSVLENVLEDKTMEARTGDEALGFTLLQNAQIIRFFIEDVWNLSEARPDLNLDRSDITRLAVGAIDNALQSYRDKGYRLTIFPPVSSVGDITAENIWRVAVDMSRDMTADDTSPKRS